MSETGSRTTTTSAAMLALVSEIATVDQLIRARLQKALPKGMEVSHFSVLNHLASTASERTPAQLSRTFHVTKAAMTNTLTKLEAAGSVHIRPDWDDGRRKFVAISPAGRRALEHATSAIEPTFLEIAGDLSAEEIKSALPVLRKLRTRLSDG